MLDNNLGLKQKIIERILNTFTPTVMTFTENTKTGLMPQKPKGLP
jgi:hypothetical protein